VFVRRAPGGDAPQVVAANVDVACIVAPLDGGAAGAREAGVHQRAVERYAALAWESGARPLVVLTKADRCPDLPAALRAAHAAAPGVEACAVSALDGAGLDLLREHLRGPVDAGAPAVTAVLLGPSGAGKSTLVNRLLGAARMATGATSADGRGRHTTTHRELVPLDDGLLLLDTPGMRELGLWDADDGVAAAFDDVEALAAGCRFGDCAHAGEPGCAVQAAVVDGRLAGDRLAAWRRLRRELARVAAREDPRAAAEARAAVRAIHRAHHRQQRGR
jgi:ribosome biogenesis GTPase